MRTPVEPTRVTFAEDTRPVPVTARVAVDSDWSATLVTSNWEPPVNSIERFRPSRPASAKHTMITAAATPTNALRLGTTR